MHALTSTHTHTRCSVKGGHARRNTQARKGMHTHTSTHTYTRCSMPCTQFPGPAPLSPGWAEGAAAIRPLPCAKSGLLNALPVLPIPKKRGGEAAGAPACTQAHFIVIALHTRAHKLSANTRTTRTRAHMRTYARTYTPPKARRNPMLQHGHHSSPFDPHSALFQWTACTPGCAPLAVHPWQCMHCPPRFAPLAVRAFCSRFAGRHAHVRNPPQQGHAAPMQSTASCRRPGAPSKTWRGEQAHPQCALAHSTQHPSAPRSARRPCACSTCAVVHSACACGTAPLPLLTWRAAVAAASWALRGHLILRTPCHGRVAGMVGGRRGRRARRLHTHTHEAPCKTLLAMLAHRLSVCRPCQTASVRVHAFHCVRTRACKRVCMHVSVHIRD